MLALSLLVCAGVSGQSAFAKAEQLSSQSNYKAALPIYLKLLQEKPKDQRLLFTTGVAYGKLEQYEQATGIYKRLLATDKNKADYHFYYGGAMALWAKNASKFKALSLLDNIKFHLKKAADLDPNHVDVRWALIQLYVELPGVVGGSLATAKQYAAELQKISPVDGYLASGFIQEYDKKFQAAEVAYKNAIKTGGSPLTYMRLAQLYSAKMNRQADAVKTLQQAYKIHKDPKLLAELKKLGS